MPEVQSSVTVSAVERVLRESAEVKEVAAALAAPFEPGEVKWKAQAVSGNRCLAVAYVDARTVQERLDDVLGVSGWQDSYECLPDGQVLCRLRVRLGGEWIEKMDVGGQSEQSDEGDRRKAAVSDALKRTAVKFGVGRYLYRIDGQWVDYDPQKKKIVGTPRLPPDALPARPAKTARVQAPAQPPPAPAPVLAETPAPAEAKKKESGKKSRQTAAQQALAESKRTMPTNGEELLRRLQDYDDRLAGEGLCRPGDLVKHISQAGMQAGHDRDMTTWSAAAIKLAIEETKAFEGRLRQSRPREVA